MVVKQTNFTITRFFYHLQKHCTKEKRTFFLFDKFGKQKKDTGRQKEIKFNLKLRFSEIDDDDKNKEKQNFYTLNHP